ncbi:hypothetical protein, partial [Leucobacter sp. M11]|uniref:hypothetical protein n=1 Tax=Leucobacter sp. M11 TaxID=2993565 RepID=UPI002D7F9195
MQTSLTRPVLRPLALLAVLAGLPLLAACSAPAADPGAPEATAQPGDASHAEYCAAGEAMYALSLPENMDPTVEFIGKMGDAVGALAEVAPPETAEAASLMRGVYAETEQAVRDLGITGSMLPADIDALQLSEEQKRALAEVTTTGFSDEFLAASSLLVTRLAEDCGVGVDAGGGAPA